MDTAKTHLHGGIPCFYWLLLGSRPFWEISVINILPQRPFLAVLMLIAVVLSLAVISTWCFEGFPTTNVSVTQYLRQNGQFFISQSNSEKLFNGVFNG